jgi:hypothetical protein
MRREKRKQLPAGSGFVAREKFMRINSRLTAYWREEDESVPPINYSSFFFTGSQSLLHFFTHLMSFEALDSPTHSHPGGSLASLSRLNYSFFKPHSHSDSLFILARLP